MLKHLKYFVVLIISTSISFSQIIEKPVEFSMGEHNTLVITLVDVDKNLVEDEWKAANKIFGKTDKKKGEFINRNVNLAGLSNPVDWYLQLDKKKGDVFLQLCVISNEEFLSSSNQVANFEVVSNFLNDFAYKVEIAKVSEKFEDEKKELAKLQKSLANTNKDIVKNNDEIDKNNKKIEKSNKDIKSNLKKQNETKIAIEEQSLVVGNLLEDSSVPSEESKKYKEFEKENDSLHKLQKKLEKLVGDYDGLLKTINKSTNKIEKAQKDNKSDKKELDKLKNKISKQGETVEKIRRQLESM